MVPAGVTNLILIAARFAGKYVSAGLAMRWAGATRRVRRYLGLALTPQAGVAVGLILVVRQDASLAAVEQLILAVGLTTVMVNEIAGSILADVALRRCGEAGRARPRLIDFLHEENIITELAADSKEQAIAELTSVLIETHHLHADRERVLRSVLDREAQASTCLGHGLAIPHGIIEEGADMYGAMAISRRGLDFDTPDGEPVHCMILLVTPPTQRDRHLEVLAALTRAVGRDPNVQEPALHGAQSRACLRGDSCRTGRGLQLLPERLVALQSLTFG